MQIEDLVKKLPQLYRKVECLKQDIANLADPRLISLDSLNVNGNDLELLYTNAQGQVSLSTDLSSLQTLEIKDNVQNFAALSTIVSPTLYQFAYVRESQGIKWINYKGSGLYMWDGTDWVEDDTDIFTQLEDLLATLVLVQNDLNDKLNRGSYLGTAQDLKDEIDQEVIDRTNDVDNLEVTVSNHINDTNNPHQTTFTEVVSEDPDTDITPAEAEELTNGSITTLHDHPYRFTAYNKQVSNDTDIPGINNTPTPAIHNTLTFNNATAGKFRFDWGFIWSLNFTGDDFIASIVIDGNVVWNLQQEPKDSAGTGVVLLNTTGGLINSGTNQRHSASDFEVLDLAPGAHTIQLIWNTAPAGAGDEATIYLSKLLIQQIG